MTKKIFFYLILLISLLAFSCASKPKLDEELKPSQQTENSEEISEQEEFQYDSEISDETAEPTAADESNNENEISDDIPETEESETEEFETEESETELISDENSENFMEVEEEKVEVDELDDISETEEEYYIEEEPLFEEEPVVQDAPLEENIFANDNETELQNDNSDSDAAEITEPSETLLQEKPANEEPAKEEPANEEPANEESANEEPAETQEEENFSETDISIENEKQEETESNNSPVPSRSLTIGKNQFIDIVYPGKGWIYQGNIDSDGKIDSKNKNFIFGGRKLGGKDQSFTLRSRQPGKYLLHFYKDDILTGSYIDDYLEVIVEDKPAETTEHITAPSYSEIVPPKVSITAEKVQEQQKKQLEEERIKNEQNEESADYNSKTRGTKVNSKSENSTKITNVTNEKDEQVSTTVQITESAPSPSDPVVKAPVERNTSKAPAADDKNIDVETDYSDAQLEKLDEDSLLEKAQKLYEAKNFEYALRTVTKFLEKASTNMDKGLFLQGQILEEKSSVQNIKDAVESYDLLVKKHPESSLSDKAKRRSIYLKRFYINIR